jgi:hypothetical protein
VVDPFDFESSEGFWSTLLIRSLELQKRFLNRIFIVESVSPYRLQYLVTSRTTSCMVSNVYGVTRTSFGHYWSVWRSLSFHTSRFSPDMGLSNEYVTI